MFNSLSLFNSIHKKWRVIGNFSKSRDNNFDAIRFLAASAVIFSHSYPLTMGNNNNKEILFIFSKGQVTLGYLSVAIFLIISGFLIYYSWERSNTIIGFLKSRMLRIFPGLFFVLLVTEFILGPLVTTLPLKKYFTDINTYIYIKSFWLHALQYELPGVFKNNIYPATVNGSLWTLEYEFLFYIIVAMTGIIKQMQKSLVLILLIISFMFDYSHLNTQWFNMIDLFRYFIIGMIFYQIRMYVPLNRYLASSFLCVLILSLIVGKYFLLIFPLLGSYLIFYIALSKKLNLYYFTRHGDFSYGLYIYAFPIQQAITFYFHNKISPLTNFIFSYPIVLTCAVISWYAIEKPCLKLKNKIF